MDIVQLLDNGSNSENIPIWKEFPIRMSEHFKIVNKVNSVSIEYLNLDNNKVEEIEFGISWEEFICKIYNDFSLSFIKIPSGDKYEWWLLVYNGSCLKSIFTLEINHHVILAGNITPSDGMMGLLNNIRNKENLCVVS